ncbi:MAG: hypothetical protein RQ952_01340 [Thermoproteota archaeon]|nr:hypothetical protein [Thermoproteota archaeon]
MDQNRKYCFFSSIARGEYKLDSDMDALIMTNKAKSA